MTLCFIFPGSAKHAVLSGALAELGESRQRLWLIPHGLSAKDQKCPGFSGNVPEDPSDIPDPSRLISSRFTSQKGWLTP